MVGLFVAYSAIFFVGEVDDIGFVNRQNYAIYLVSGFLAWTFASRCWSGTTLLKEKVMQTLEGTFLAPISRIYILLGKALLALFYISLAIIPHTILLILLRPTVVSGWGLLLGLLSLPLLLSIFISLDFMVSAMELAQEGIAGIVRSWAPRGLHLFSCIYYPIAVFPGVLKPITLLNPAYHGISLFRSAFITTEGLTTTTLSFLYLVILGLSLPILAVRFFEWRFKKYGIKGY